MGHHRFRALLAAAGFVVAALPVAVGVPTNAATATLDPANVFFDDHLSSSPVCKYTGRGAISARSMCASTGS